GLGVRLREVAVELAQGRAVDLLAERGLPEQRQRRHPLRRHLELVDDGERGGDLAKRLGVLALVEKEVRNDQTESCGIGAHTDRLELLLSLLIGLYGGPK